MPLNLCKMVSYLTSVVLNSSNIILSISKMSTVFYTEIIEFTQTQYFITMKVASVNHWLLIPNNG
ncbi:Uncharacterised protein [Neisseria meningitidis]|nr:Uncharacterised protein [Neisseria meningitidis]CWT95536.1 Uncharacterised protein [Neisseria meningitidis]